MQQKNECNGSKGSGKTGGAKDLVKRFCVLISKDEENPDDLKFMTDHLEKKKCSYIIFEVIGTRKWKGIDIQEKYFVLCRELDQRERSYDFDRSCHLRKQKYQQVSVYKRYP